LTPSRSNYHFNPFDRSLSVIGNNSEASFSGTFIGDFANPLDTPEYFVRQQYLDILGREPDETGFNYWSDQILACGNDADCITTKRNAVAAAFFIEQEFQQSGSFIYDVYSSALGRRPAYKEYVLDRKTVVGGSGLESAKTVFVEGFVMRDEFVAKYQSFTNAESFVDALLENASLSGVDHVNLREGLIATYNSQASLAQSRAAVVKEIADNPTFKQSQYNRAFVLMQYFGYLRRNPDRNGYDFWVNILNQNPQNFGGMVCSFITSFEYQHRFSTQHTRSNNDCQ
jgi:hypothetical protein